MLRKTITLATCIITLACTLPGRDKNPAGNDNRNRAISPPDTPFINTIQDIPLPPGYHRKAVPAGSFAAFLRNIPIKKSHTVLLYNGAPKRNQEAHYAILDIPVGNKDLQQCADAVMRLKAEYLFAAKQYNDIVFRDNEGHVYTFTAPYTRAALEQFMLRVFGMCGSASLEKELSPVRPFTEIQAGDVLIRGGFPGHAEIVTDIAVNNAGEKIYLLAQSYMPAQDIHIVKNPVNEDSNPWYDANDTNNEIYTPEYTFTRNQLRRWAGL